MELAAVLAGTYLAYYHHAAAQHGALCYLRCLPYYGNVLPGVKIGLPKDLVRTFLRLESND